MSLHESSHAALLIEIQRMREGVATVRSALVSFAITLTPSDCHKAGISPAAQRVLLSRVRELATLLELIDRG